MKEHLRSDWANRENEKSGEKMRVPLGILWEMTVKKVGVLYIGWRVQVSFVY